MTKSARQKMLAKRKKVLIKAKEDLDILIDKIASELNCVHFVLDGDAETIERITSQLIFRLLQDQIKDEIYFASQL